MNQSFVPCSALLKDNFAGYRIGDIASLMDLKGVVELFKFIQVFPYWWISLVAEQWEKKKKKKKSTCNSGDIRDAGLIPGSGRSPGEGHGNPLQWFCQENPMDRGDWKATIHGVTKSGT